VAFGLKAGQPIGDEIRRIVSKQFELAASELTAIGTPHSDEAIHRARRRVKKIRAVIRLVRPALGDTFGPVDKRLRRTVKLLAPVADGQGVVQALDELATRYSEGFSRPVFETIRAGLVEREARADRKAKADRVLERVTETLRKERTHVKHWRIRGNGFKRLAPALETSFWRAKKAMAKSVEHPTADNYHRWRRRVKDHWFHVRLIETRCGNRLGACKRRLEALDACLGDDHNFALLRAILGADPFVSRQETARRLRLIHRYQTELRRRAQLLGARVYAEQPRDFVRRVRTLWRLTNLVGAPVKRRCRSTD
jgi:CHAD domain-containing protein